MCLNKEFETKNKWSLKYEYDRRKRHVNKTLNGSLTGFLGLKNEANKIKITRKYAKANDEQNSTENSLAENDAKNANTLQIMKRSYFSLAHCHTVL